VMVNLASLHAAINVLRGKRIERWEPARAEAWQLKSAPPGDPEPAATAPAPASESEAVG
jgi:hypothetical protein